MSLTPAQVKTIQEVLVKQGFLIGAAPSEEWTAQACNGYKHYQLNNGVQYPHCDLLPEGLHSLSQEMKDAISGVVVEPVVAEKADEAPTKEEPKQPVAPKAETAIRISKNRK